MIYSLRKGTHTHTLTRHTRHNSVRTRLCLGDSTPQGSALAAALLKRESNVAHSSTPAARSVEPVELSVTNCNCYDLCQSPTPSTPYIRKSYLSINQRRRHSFIGSHGILSVNFKNHIVQITDNLMELRPGDQNIVYLSIYLSIFIYTQVHSSKLRFKNANAIG